MAGEGSVIEMAELAEFWIARGRAAQMSTDVIIDEIVTRLCTSCMPGPRRLYGDTMSKAHDLNLTEHLTHHGDLRIELNCPSGCVKGYIWGEAGMMRALSKAMALAHKADREAAS